MVNDIVEKPEVKAISLTFSQSLMEIGDEIGAVFP